jgi:long-chain acyl-CoA synthetase
MYGYLKNSIQDKTKEKLIFYNYGMKGQELLEIIDSLAFYLVNLGVKKGESVGICLPNIPQAAISLYAINKIAAVANIIHPKISSGGLIKILKKTATKTIFMFDRTYAEYASALESQDINVICCSLSSFLKRGKKIMAEIFCPKIKQKVIPFDDTVKQKGEIDREVNPFDDAVYLHSGGTTGKPKTVRLSSYALNAFAYNLLRYTSQHYRYSQDDSMLMVLPLFHGFGLGVCVHLALTIFKLVMMPKFNAKQAIKLIKKHGINYLAGIPAMFEKMLCEKSFDSEGISSLKLIFCGADKLNPNIKKRFDEILKKNNSTAEIFEGYGLSEVTSVATVNVTGISKAGTHGKPMFGVKIKIIDDNGKECKAGEVGETLIQSQSMMNGYLDSDEECYYIDENNEKWLRTGDLGSLDEEGFYTFKSRIKRVIKIAGVNIYPSEIEELVCSMKEIDAACVVRTYIDNKPCTKLIVKMNKDYKYSALIEQRIKSRIAQEFIKYAVPQRIETAKKLYLTSLGKMDYLKYEEEENSP